jgi:hypothetical protein
VTVTVDRPATGPGQERLPRGDEFIDSLRHLGRVLTGSLPRPDTDWTVMADLARHQGVAPLLFWRLGQSKNGIERGGSVPQEVLEGLRVDLYSATVQGMLAEQQLSVVLGALSTVAVPAVVIKGAALGAFYPDPVLRLYADIDIMIPKAQLDEAERALNAIGYECFAPKAWWLDRFHHLPPMVSDGGGLPIELHWRVDYQVQKGRLPADDLWARAVPWSVHDQPALRLDAVDAALHLCRHAVVQHRAYGAFHYLCDLAQVTQGWGQGEWETLTQRALDYGLGRPVYPMLVLGEHLLNLSVPVEAVSALRPSGTIPEPEDMLRRFMASDGASPTRISVGAVQAVAEGPPAAQLQRLMGNLFLPREGMAMVYGIPADSPRIWLTYLWRPIDLLGRYGLSAWKALRGERGARAAWQRDVWLERWLRSDADRDGVEDG